MAKQIAGGVRFSPAPYAEFPAVPDQTQAAAGSACVTSGITRGTAMLKSKIHLKIAQEGLGHSTIAITIAI